MSLPWVYAVIYSFIAIKVLIMIIGLLGNLLVIIVIVKNKRLHTRVYALLVNLAAADLMSLTICVPHSILQEFKWIYKPTLLCKLAFGFEHMFTMASSFTIVVIALERLIVIWLPLRGPSLLAKSSLRAAVMLALWLLSMLVTLPFFFGGSAHSTEMKDRHGNITGWSHVCRLPKSPGPNASEEERSSVSMVGLPPETFYIVSTCLELYLPMHLIVVLYVAIFYKLLRSFRRLGGGCSEGNGKEQHQNIPLQSLQQPPQQQQQQQHGHHRTHRCRVNTGALMERKRVVYFSVLVATVYFLTVAPFRSLALCLASDGCFRQLQHTLGDSGLFFTMHSLVILLYTNHCLNPVLYNLASRRFRRATSNFLRSGLPRRCRLRGPTLAVRNGCAVPMETRTVRATTRRTRFKSRTNNCDLAV